MPRLAFLLPLGLFLLFIGCDSSEPDPDPINPDSITGAWQGEVASTNVMGVTDTFRIDLNLTQARMEITGDGIVTGPDGPLPFDVLAGSSYFHPSLNLDLFFGGPPFGGLDGIVAEDRKRIRGTMTGPGFSGLAELQIVLTRMTP